MPDTRSGAAVFMESQRRDVMLPTSKRLANKIATAGIIERIERALIVQFTKLVKSNVPRTHNDNNIQSASARRQPFAITSPRTESPPARYKAICPLTRCQCV